MFYIYILRSNKNNKLYIGYTDDLETRLAEHNHGKVISTKAFCPWELVYYEAYLAREDALKREKALKYFGKAYSQLKRRIEKSLNWT